MAVKNKKDEMRYLSTFFQAKPQKPDILPERSVAPGCLCRGVREQIEQTDSLPNSIFPIQVVRFKANVIKQIGKRWQKNRGDSYISSYDL